MCQKHLSKRVGKALSTMDMASGYMSLGPQHICKNPVVEAHACNPDTEHKRQTSDS